MTAPPRRPPNLLLITTDQQRWDTLSCCGQPGYRTPNLDRLAADGVRFDRAYAPSPVCTPARVSILTGQYPTRTGAYQIGMEPVPCLAGPTLASRLAEAGYHTAIIGKTHFVARSIESEHVAGRPDAPPDSLLLDTAFWRQFDGPYLGFQFVRHASGHTNCKPPNCHYRAWLEAQGLDLDDLHYAWRDGQFLPGDLKQGAWPIDEQHTQTAWITEQAIRYVERQQATGRPWFCWASYQDPHPPFVCPEPYFSAVDMTGVDLGGFREGEFDDKPPFYKRFIEGRGWSDRDELPFPDGDLNVPFLFTYDHVEDPYPAIQAYLGMVNMLDAYVGRLLDALDRLGARDNTLIVFTSDHGEMLGRHGLWQKGAVAFDDCQRIPAVASWPAGQRRAVGVTRSMLNLVDVLPTFLDAAGVACPPLVQGVSQLPVIRGDVKAVRDWALVDFLVTSKLHQQTFVCEGHKLVVYRHADYGELYDLSDDPDQYVNLFDRPEHRAVRDRLMHRLVQAHMTVAGTMPRRIHTA